MNANMKTVLRLARSNKASRIRFLKSCNNFILLHGAYSALMRQVADHHEGKGEIDFKKALEDFNQVTLLIESMIAMRKEEKEE